MGRELRILGGRGFGLAVRLVAMAIGVVLPAGQAARAQADAATANSGTAAFEVVSIRPVAADAKVTMVGIMSTPDGMEASRVTVMMLVKAAYGGYMELPTDDRVSGLPEWAKTETFDVKARMSEQDAAAMKTLSDHEKEARREAMLRAMLADRFQLKAHSEERQMSDYDLVVAKGGAKLKQGGTNANGPKDNDGKPVMGSYLRLSGFGKAEAQGLSMDGLAHFLMQPMVGLGRPVVNQTGLTGKYDFSLNWLPDVGLVAAPDGPHLPPPPDASGPSIFTALEEELGLRLQPSSGRFDVVIVEHVEQPSVN